MNYHYVYRITDQSLNKHYYGVRSCKINPKFDLGIKYFSSSTDHNFIMKQKDNPHLFKYKIIKLFSNRDQANKFEITIHKKFNIGINESFYNKCSATSSGFCVSGIKLGNRHTKEYLLRCHLNFGDTSGENNSMYGTSRIGEENPFFGKKHSDQSIKKMKNTKSKILILDNGDVSTSSKEGGKKCSRTKSSQGWKATVGVVAKEKFKNTLKETIVHNGIKMTKKESQSKKRMETIHKKANLYEVHNIYSGYVETLNQITLRKKYGNTIFNNTKENYRGKRPAQRSRLEKSSPSTIGLYVVKTT